MSTSTPETGAMAAATTTTVSPAETGPTAETVPTGETTTTTAANQTVPKPEAETEKNEPAAPAPASVSASVSAPKSEPIPPAETLEKIYASEVLDQDGKAIKFGSLVQGTAQRRNVVVFVRHFYCGYCQEYIRALSRSLPPEKLSALPIPTTLTIIGCGEPGLIPAYVAETSCPYPLYADPSRKIYSALGLVVSLASSKKKPKYISVSFFTSTFAGIKQGLKAGVGTAMKSGKISQNGGELVWVDGECRFVHRMKDTTSHLEIEELEQVLREVV